MSRITRAYGLKPLQNVFPEPIIALRAPTTSDTNYDIGQIWVYKTTGQIYGLANVASGSATWSILGPGASDVDTLTGDSGGAISPSSGNITLAGTANQITTTGSGSTITWSLPSSITAPGSLTTTTTLAAGTTVTGGTGVIATTGDITASAGDIVATLGDISTGAGSITSATTLTATLGDITATNGNLVLTAAGNKINRGSVATTTAAGANSIGSVTLSSGTATVSTTAVTANSLIKIWRQSVGATGAAALGHLSVGTITAGTSFVINALQAADATAVQTTDVSVVGWEIVN